MPSDNNITSETAISSVTLSSVTPISSVVSASSVVSVSSGAAFSSVTPACSDATFSSVASACSDVTPASAISVPSDATVSSGGTISSESSQKEQWTILKLLTWTEVYFKKFDIDSPRLTAEILLSHTLGSRRLDLYLQFDRPLNRDELAGYKQLIKRRVKNREPVAYITGDKGFRDSEFSVSPHVLIPRPDTEILVEQAVVLINAFRIREEGQKLKILELGTGSGAVIVSLARECAGHTFFATDLSIAAVEIAWKNAKNVLSDQNAKNVLSDQNAKNVLSDHLVDSAYAPPVHFWAASWLDTIRPGILFDLIISNPPYIPSGDIPSLQPEIRNHEPRLALDGGHGGFDCFRQIIASAVHCLEPGGFLLMEMGFDQREQMEKETARFPQYHEPRFVRDYAGHDRVVILRLNEGYEGCQNL